MHEFVILLTQVFIISCVQTILEVFIDKDERPYQVKIINVACFAGSMYLVLVFIFNTLIKELISMMGSLSI